MRTREKKVTATFKGLNGSCGFIHGREYKLTLNKISLQKFSIRDLDGNYCEYGSMLAFLDNWDNVKNFKSQSSNIKEVKTLILSEKNLLHGINKHVSMLSCTDFNISIEMWKTYSLVLFVDSFGKTKVIKNRFGHDGVVN